VTVDLSAFNNYGPVHIAWQYVGLDGESFILDLVEVFGEVNLPWLAEDPISGSVPANSSLDIDVTFDSTGLAFGDYTGDLKVTSLPYPDSIVTTVLHVVPNIAPIAVADAYSTDQDTELVVAVPGVLANDTDENTDALTAELFDDVASGTLVLAEDGSFTYMPDAGFVGEDSFTYKAFDGVDYSNVVTVTITVKEVAPTDFTLFLPLIMK